MAILSGCLTKTPVRPVEPISLMEFHPEPPAPLDLEEETFLTCPHEDPGVYVCMTLESARRVTRNKIKMLRWSKEMRAEQDFYTGAPDPTPVKIDNSSKK